MFQRPLAALLLLAGLSACGARNDLAEPPVPLGGFVLGHNIVVAENVQKVPISRDASPAEWETAMKKAVSDRFGRYTGERVYNIGISVDAFALAPPGVPVLAAPKSVLVVTANIWDDAAQKKLNAEGKQFTVFESLSGETVIGTGLTRSKQQQMQALAFNAAKRVEDWLLENPEWFGMTKAELEAAMKARAEAMAATPAAAPVTVEVPTTTAAPAAAQTTPPATQTGLVLTSVPEGAAN